MFEQGLIIYQIENLWLVDLTADFVDPQTDENGHLFFTLKKQFQNWIQDKNIIFDPRSLQLITSDKNNILEFKLKFVGIL